MRPATTSTMRKTRDMYPDASPAVSPADPAERLAVTFRGLRAGWLAATSAGLVFTYDPRWLRTSGAVPLSLTMPLRPEPYGDAVITPWIQNLLPEADVGQVFARALGLSVGDAYGILRAAGADTAGAFSFDPPNGSAQDIDQDHASENAQENTLASGMAGGRYLPLRDYATRHGAAPKDDGEALKFLLEGLAQRPFFADEDGVRLSLAGGQVKTALATLDEKGRPVHAASGAGVVYAIPLGAAASNLIVKPDNSRLLGIVEIEAYCLELARRCGLDAVDWTILEAGGRLALAVPRYDRQIRTRRDGRVELVRIHQEDFCQLLGLPPLRKYETATGGGARLADLFAAARLHLGPKDQLRFLDCVIFNILVGNTDAHAKNYSVLIHPDQTVLAPLYDVNSVLAWKGVNQNHAQKIAGRTRKPVDTARRHWEAIAEEAGLNPREVLRRVNALATRIVHAAQDARQPVIAAPGTTAKIVDDISERIDEHARRIQGRL